jgi:hypothetical protein
MLPVNNEAQAQATLAPSRKIALTKLGEVVAPPKTGGVIGWEYTPPQKGRPYVIYLEKGLVLRTSLVQEVQKGRNTLLLKTLNSLYRVDYLTEEMRI